MTRVLALLLVTWASHLAAAATITEVHYVMGTYFQITADADAAHVRTALRRCFATARAADERFSRFDPRSELSRINGSDASSLPVSAEMAALLDQALSLRVATGGAFDVGAGGLTALWRTADAWPSAAQVVAAQAQRGLLTVRGTMLVRGRGGRVDLDGIAKGWAVDRCVEQLRSGGIRSALLSLGESSLYALGAPPGHRGWDVALRGLDPERALGTLTLHDEAVSVSAVFGHEHRIGTRRVGHILDPRSGYPLQSPAMAVVVATSATDAEAFSKALLVQAAQNTDAGLTCNTNASPRHARCLQVPSPYQGEGQGEVDRLAAPSVIGTLLVRPGGVQRSGRIAFARFKSARPIAATAEPLR